MTSPIYLIVNASAGATHGPSAVDDVMAVLQAGDAAVELTVAKNGDEIVAAVKRAIAAKAAIVAVGGGDGTLSTVAGMLVGSNIALGILPFGTLNHFAKDNGIPLDLKEAAQVIVAGQTRRVDVGEVNDRVFINNASVGLYPRIVRRRVAQQERFGWGKWTAFTRAMLAVMYVYRLMKLHLRLDDEEIDSRLPFVFIGNNAYTTEGFHLGERARLDAGVLSVYFVRRCGRMRLMGMALRALIGMLHQARDFEMRLVRELVIDTHHATVEVARDGEVCALATPLRFGLRAKALCIVAPPKEG